MIGEQIRWKVEILGGTVRDWTLKFRSPFEHEARTEFDLIRYEIRQKDRIAYGLRLVKETTVTEAVDAVNYELVEVKE